MFPHHRSGVRAVHFVFTCLLAAAAIASLSVPAAAQHADRDDDHDHGHDYLHFSHPLITESPSPDTKVRLDAAFESSDVPPGSRSTALRGEVEYAFSRSLSLAIVAPFVRITSPRGARGSALGSVELSAKAASLVFARSGVLVGGGMSVGLPTGSDAKGIGSGHLYELSPFVDAAMRRGNVEAVGFLTYSTVTNRHAGDPSEGSATLNGSVLWRVVPQIELLGEVATSRAIGGGEGAHYETFLAPGIKWRPESWPKLAIGVAAVRGVGIARTTNGVQLSAFYHL